MNEEKLKTIMRRLWSESEEVLGNTMVNFYSIESIIREVCEMKALEDE